MLMSANGRPLRFCCASQDGGSIPPINIAHPFTFIFRWAVLSFHILTGVLSSVGALSTRPIPVDGGKSAVQLRHLALLCEQLIESSEQIRQI